MADSQVQLHQVLTEGGTPTSVFAFTVEVTRNDTQAVVVPAGTAMVQVTPGVYEYAFTAPAPNLAYTATYTITATEGEEAISYSQTIHDRGEWRPPKPRYTGDWLQDTLAMLLWQRLAMLMAGFAVSYQVHDHRFNKMEYMQYLDNAVMQLRKELAQRDVVECISAVGGYDGDW